MHLLTYLLTYTVGSGVQNRNIFETVEDRAKVTINGLYKGVHALSIAAKTYDLEWPLGEIQVHWFLKYRENGEIQLSDDYNAM